MSDEAAAFTSFIAIAQVVEGLSLLVIGSSSAVQIIGAVVLGFGCLTAAALFVARRRSGRRPSPGARSRPTPPSRTG